MSSENYKTDVSVRFHQINHRRRVKVLCLDHFPFSSLLRIYVEMMDAFVARSSVSINLDVFAHLKYVEWQALRGFTKKAENVKKDIFT